ncbi:transglycosylase SLT domain-containing protein [Arenibacterium halophilum]|jgi:soluble lytic murein transglycosylase-like protein|uniref:Lytic transglycosylase domain-containing protein n=1 Tax=Arenibacterium halophilum TaxID=2583821 RepID=A0ABY2XC26_9RHOB|nr:lytic transglycosylase domain-containing protein [Arenibacterium halophilum]MAY85601.1 lytic transglycosylase [Pseudooceanicola sp.]TMV14572.1 lytic transglycosylase domain-containing protein [Arenibacterium halophilum]
MLNIRRFLGLALCALALSACAMPSANARAPFDPPLHPNETPELRQLINTYADEYEVPRTLVHRLAIRESTHRPGAINRPYYGLLQILPATARSMGFRGQPNDLLDPETNLKYAVKYLRGAWLLADGSQDAAVGLYARGYYYEAKRRGMLQETGLAQ